MYIKTKHNGKEYLFNGRAYLSVDSTEDELKQLEEELGKIEIKEKFHLYQIQIFEKFFETRELPENTEKVLEDLEEGQECLIKACISDAQIKKVSKKFVSVKWRSYLSENNSGGNFLIF